MKIARPLCRGILPFFIIFLFSCAVITVNIYFPSKAVEKAYENLEDQLMKPPPASKPKKEGPEHPPAQEKNSFLNPFSWFVGTVYAGENLSAQISQHIAKMPEVVNAYRRMGKRLAATNQLRNKRLAGESNSGMLSPFVRLNRNQGLLLENENHDRSVVIYGMAKAILEINHLKLDKKNLNEVYPKAAAQFAELRRKRAKPGWKIQLPNGKWVIKK
jgi:hypothetical protein